MGFKKKVLPVMLVLGLVASTIPVEASDYVPSNIGKLNYYNAYRGDYYLNENENGTGKFKQGRYIDHIDVRTDDARITVNYLENGVLVDSKVQNAKVTNVTGILVNDSPYLMINGKQKDFVSKGVKRDDGVVGKAEYNFQIVQHGPKGSNGYIPKENHDFDFKNKWLDLTTVYKITIIATLTVYDENGNPTDYENVNIVINGLPDIIQTSYCSNGSGLDYYLQGDVSNNIVVEIPVPPEPEIPEVEPLEITLVPATGDSGISIGTTTGIIVASFMLLIINKKIKK